jgi:ABC-type bacteriocin/lantibiotic exporter with double-glycine peptidase domain
MNKYRILYKYFKKHIKWAIIGGVMMILGVSLLIPTPLLTMYLIDTVLPSSNIKALIYISILCVIILIVKAICDNVQQFFFVRFNHMTVFDIQLDILKSFQKSSTHYRHHKQSGYLMSRITDDPNQIQSLFADTLISLMKDIITLIIGVIIIFYLHFKLAFVTIALLPFFIIFIKKYNQKIKKMSKELLELNAQYKKKLQESLSMIDTFTIFNALNYDTIKLIQKKKEYIRADIKRNVVGNIGGAIISIISGIGPIIVLIYGFYEIMMKRLTLGELLRLMHSLDIYSAQPAELFLLP